MPDQHGFELVEEQAVPEVNSTMKIFRHKKTGSELLSVENDDENKVFSITFCTPPPDSTGLPHIMEHSVLGGSRKYPVKDPFMQLIKGSLKTFVNAFTSSDKTTYPVASQNVADFYNLVDVYLDAVLYPRISPETLIQEGWHYHLTNIDDPLTYNGIVFNEMKGTYSSPDNVLYRYTQRALFPDNVYALDSGGDPTVIPQLTYEQFKAFHETYYHPANARFFFYGDDDPVKRLQLLDDYLKDFDAKAIDTEIKLQPRFPAPKRTVHEYDAGEGDPKEMVTVAWMLPESVDSELAIALEILEHILLGAPASPLRKALLESGLGEGLAGGGFYSGLRQAMFSTGMKGVAAGDSDKVEALVIEVLGKLATEGIDPETVEMSLNTIEFQMREFNTGGYPRGLLMLMRAATTWIYGGNPIETIAFDAPMAAIKEKVAQGEKYFEGLISEHFVENTHRSTVILEPDSELHQRLDAAEKARLEEAQSAMSTEDLQAVIENTQRLKALQEAPDTPEALATIPMLSLDDLDKQIKTVPLEVLVTQGSQVLYHDLFTNGIVYLDIGFNLHALPQEYLPYVTLFGRALVEIGTETEDFVTLSQRIGRKTGGIEPTTLVSQKLKGDDSIAWLLLRGKSTVTQTDHLLAILHDMLTTVKFDNQDRFSQMVLEEKASLEAGLVPMGHSVVNKRLHAHFHQAGWANEQMSGISYLFFLRDLVTMVENDWPAVVQRLEDIRRYLLNRELMLCNVTVDTANWETIRPKLDDFLNRLPSTPAKLPAWTPEYGTENEGLTIPAQVNYVGKGARLYDLGYDLDGSAPAVIRYLTTTWMYDRIRVQGGAYGGFILFDINSGVLNFLSYRDPNLLATLDSYDGTGDFVRQLELDEAELTKAIIGAIGQMDTYQLPDAKGYTSMQRYLVGIDDDYRQKMRDAVLSTTPQDFQALVEVLDHVKETGTVVVLGSQEAIAEANQSQEDMLTVKKVL